MSSLELKIPPPAVALLVGLLMWLASLFSAPLEVPFGIRFVIALVLAAAGLALDVAGMMAFWRARTTINPMKPTGASSLVTTGPFRFTRNPMYLSMVLYLIAWAVYLSNVVAFLFVPMFVLYINRFQIKPEERALDSVFGAEYAAYKTRVRRWL